MKGGVDELTARNSSFDTRKRAKLYGTGLSDFRWQCVGNDSWSCFDRNHVELTRISFSAQVDKGLEREDGAWLSYRRNHIHIVTSLETNGNETVAFLRDPGGTMHAVSSLAVAVRGVESVHHTPVPMYVTNTNRQDIGEPGVFAIEPSRPTRITRLHFRRATLNSVPKPDSKLQEQEFFRLVVTLQPVSTAQETLPPIVTLISEPFVVRGCSPKQFAAQRAASGQACPGATEYDDVDAVIPGKRSPPDANAACAMTAGAGAANSQRAVPMAVGGAVSVGNGGVWADGGDGDANSTPPTHTGSSDSKSGSIGHAAGSTGACGSVGGGSGGGGGEEAAAMDVAAFTTGKECNLEYAPPPQAEYGSGGYGHLMANGYVMGGALGGSPMHGGGDDGDDYGVGCSDNGFIMVPDADDEDGSGDTPLDHRGAAAGAALNVLLSPISHSTPLSASHSPRASPPQGAYTSPGGTLYDDFPAPLSAAPALLFPNAVSAMEPGVAMGSHTAGSCLDSHRTVAAQAPGWQALHVPTRTSSRKRPHEGTPPAGQRQATVFRGRVGINTDQPQAPLHVHGDVRLTGAVIKPSDARVKQDLRPVDKREQLDNIKKLQIYDYNLRPEWMAASGREQAEERGVIAQELREVIPSAVTTVERMPMGDGEDIFDFLSVDHNRIFMENVGATQQIAQDVQGLESRVEALESTSQRRRKLCRRCCGADLEKSEQRRRRVLIAALIFLIFAVLGAVATAVVLAELQKSGNVVGAPSGPVSACQPPGGFPQVLVPTGVIATFSTTGGLSVGSIPVGPTFRIRVASVNNFAKGSCSIEPRVQVENPPDSGQYSSFVDPVAISADGNTQVRLMGSLYQIVNGTTGVVNVQSLTNSAVYNNFDGILDRFSSRLTGGLSRRDASVSRSVTLSPSRSRTPFASGTPSKSSSSSSSGTRSGSSTTTLSLTRSLTSTETAMSSTSSSLSLSATTTTSASRSPPPTPSSTEAPHVVIVRVLS